MNEVKFAVMTDLHLDIIQDGTRRMNAFLQAAQKADVDFIIQLGDFSYPKDTSTCLCAPDKMPINLKLAMQYPSPSPKAEILNKYNSFEKPSYHVLGNHEMDFCSKEDAVSIYKMENSYYAFHIKNWHFIVLDCNNYKNKNGEITDNYYGEYFETDDLPYLGEKQLNWLWAQLQDTNEPVVIFSHQPLYSCTRGLRNTDELQRILDKAKQNGKKIFLSMNGHIHKELTYRSNNTIYYTLNSISNYWIGAKYATHRFCKKTEATYPNLQYTVPYQKPIFGIVSLTESGMKIDGVNGRFVSPSPIKKGFSETLTPSVKSQFLYW